MNYFVLGEHVSPLRSSMKTPTKPLFGVLGFILLLVVSYFVHLVFILYQEYHFAMKELDYDDNNLLILSPTSADKICLSPYANADTMVDEVSHLLADGNWNSKTDQGLTVLSRPVPGEWGKEGVPVCRYTYIYICLTQKES